MRRIADQRDATFDCFSGGTSPPPAPVRRGTRSRQRDAIPGDGSRISPERARDEGIKAIGADHDIGLEICMISKDQANAIALIVQFGDLMPQPQNARRNRGYHSLVEADPQQADEAASIFAFHFERKADVRTKSSVVPCEDGVTRRAEVIDIDADELEDL